MSSFKNRPAKFSFFKIRRRSMSVLPNSTSPKFVEKSEPSQNPVTVSQEIMSIQSCPVLHCSTKHRSDHLLRHLYTHRSQIQTVMQGKFITLMTQHKKPIMIVGSRGKCFCVCLYCKQGAKDMTEQAAGLWAMTHTMTNPACKSPEAWAQYEPLFLLAAGPTPDAPPMAQNFVSVNSVCGSTDDDADSTESLPSATAGFSAKDEQLIREFRRLETAHGDILRKQERIEFTDKCYCLADRGKQAREQRHCVCYVCGKNEEYNRLVSLRAVSQTKKDEFKAEYPDLHREYYNRLTQRGGYDW
jgi:hypothetical protein